MKIKKIKFFSLCLFILLFILFSILCLRQVKQINNQFNTNFAVFPALQADPSQVHQVFESYIIPQPHYLLSAHSSTVEVLPDGSLIAFWFAGTKEGNPDVDIWQSYFKNGIWTDATPVVTRKSISNDTQMFVKKIGNPVVYKAVNNYLHLFVVSVGFGGWSGSSINHLISKDNGKTWGKAQKITLSPIFNISTLVRTHPITLANGGFCLPVYNESIRNYPELLYFDSQGNFIRQQRMNDINRLIQPSMVVISPELAFVYFRNHTATNSPMLMQAISDSGKKFVAVRPTNIFNQDSSMATVNLGHGQLLMVRNGLTRGRLLLSVSSDGIHWRDIADLENDNGGEFSYPSLQIHGDIVDILYTWQRKYIKHIRFNDAWLEHQEKR